MKVLEVHRQLEARHVLIQFAGDSGKLVVVGDDQFEQDAV